MLCFAPPILIPVSDVLLLLYVRGIVLKSEVIFSIETLDLMAPFAFSVTELLVELSKIGKERSFVSIATGSFTLRNGLAGVTSTSCKALVMPLERISEVK